MTLHWTQWFLLIAISLAFITALFNLIQGVRSFRDSKLTAREVDELIERLKRGVKQ